jgi:5-dehydro-2-deoxygluconokinase
MGDATAPVGASTATPVDVLAIGRVGIDLYPLEDRVPLDRVSVFGRFLGGSPANVAVAAARLGRSAALITRTGADPFARFVRDELQRLGVRDDFVASVQDRHTTLAFCEIFPPDHFPLHFVRDPVPPEMEIAPGELDLVAVAGAGVFWATLSGVAREPSRSAHHAAWRARARRRFTVLDLDYRPTYWATPGEAGEEGRRALAAVDVVVGNVEECGVVVGEADPDRAAEALLAAGPDLAVVKLGPRGVLARSRSERVRVPAVPVDVVNGLGAGDAFGGALCHALLAGSALEDALWFASAAGAIVAGRRECSTAMPTLEEVEALLTATHVRGPGR